jgi:hypothetical protein
MQQPNKEQIVMTGTFRYDGLPLCKVRIVQTDVRPGSGDNEDSEEQKEDDMGIFFRIDYTPARSDRFAAGGGHCASLQDAIHTVEQSVEGVVWDS